MGESVYEGEAGGSVWLQGGIGEQGAGCQCPWDKLSSGGGQKV